MQKVIIDSGMSLCVAINSDSIENNEDTLDDDTISEESDNEE